MRKLYFLSSKLWTLFIVLLLCFSSTESILAGEPVRGTAVQRLLTEAKCGQASSIGFYLKGQKEFGLSTNHVLKSTALSHCGKVSMRPLMNASNGVTLWGSVISASNWESTAYGIYSFNAVSNPTISPISVSPLMFASGGGVFYDNEFHFVSVNAIGGGNLDVRSYTYDLDTKDYITKYENTSCPANMMSLSTAYDPTSGAVYGCYYTEDRSAFEFGTANYEKFTRTTITHLGNTKAYVAMAVSKDGTLYAIRENGNLYTLDKKSGAETLVGPTGVNPYVNLQSACFDYDTGKLYWNARHAESTGVVSSLYEVNLKTGAATLIGDFANGEMIPSMFVKNTPADRAPGKAANLTLVYDEGATDGIIGFDIPDKCADGKSSLALFGNVDYVVVANTDTIAKGASKAKETVSINASLPKGQVRVKVILSNRYGKGETAIASQWIGPDIPRWVSGEKANVDEEGNVTISWTAPTRGINSGYLGDIRYRITRQPDNVVVADSITSTSCTDKVPTSTLRSYYYTIVPFTDGGDGREGYTNNIRVGQYVTAPYHEGFDFSGSFDLFDFPKKSSGVNDWTYNGDNKCAGYNATGDVADDWMVTPPIKLSADHEYVFSFRAHTRELMGVLFAHQITAGFMPTKLNASVVPSDFVKIIDTTTVKSTDWVTYKATVRPSAGTDYYRFGIHEVTKTANWMLYVDDISIDAGASFKAPDSVQGLRIKAADKGVKKAVLSFNAPDKTIGGDKLNNIDSIRIYRDDKLIKTLYGVVAGSSQSVENIVPKSGTYTYKVVAYNTEGEGSSIEKSGWIGVDVPLTPSKVTLEDNFDGTAKLSWKFWDYSGAHGGYVDPLLGTAFNIYKYEDNQLVKAVKDSVYGREYQVPAPLEGDQKMLYHAVSAVTEAGESEPVYSNSIITGAPYNLPFKESFSNAGLDNKLWSVNSTGSSEWKITSQLPSDDDGGSVYFIPGASGDRSILESGKITPVGSDNLKLVFDYYAIKGDMQLNVYVTVPGGTRKPLEGIDFSKFTSTDGKWMTKVIDLNDYANYDYIRVSFEAASAETALPVVIDNISVRNVQAKDLTGSLIVPHRVTAGKSSPFIVNVTNLGEQDADNFSIDFYVDGKKVQTASNLSLPAYSTKNFSFDIAVDVQTKESAKAFAHINYEGDLDLENNDTEVKTFDVKSPTLAVVNDLKLDESTKRLTWSKPSNTAEPIAEDFEDYTPFSLEFGDWKTADLDSADVYFYQDITFPFSSQKMSFGVFSPSKDGVDVSQVPSLKPHSGEQYLVCLGAEPNSAKNGQNDDWLISPELSGDSQKISFYAKSASDQYGLEDFEVLYSLEGDSTKYFTARVSESNTQAPTSWTLYEYELPKGAKYFAIHSTSKDKFMLMIDDISFEGAKLTINGYNVYRDGLKIAKTAEAEYDLNDTGNHSYFVTVVYSNAGESLPSNSVGVRTGVNSVDADALMVSGGNGQLVIRDRRNKLASVYTIDGRLISKTYVNGEKTIKLAQGLYLVKVDNRTYRVVIK